MKISTNTFNYFLIGLTLSLSLNANADAESVPSHGIDTKPKPRPVDENVEADVIRSQRQLKVDIDQCYRDARNQTSSPQYSKVGAKSEKGCAKAIAGSNKCGKLSLEECLIIVSQNAVRNAGDKLLLTCSSAEDPKTTENDHEEIVKKLVEFLNGVLPKGVDEIRVRIALKQLFPPFGEIPTSVAFDELFKKVYAVLTGEFSK